MHKELSIGAGAALLIFLLVGGYNIGPLLLIAVMCGVLFYMLRTRGMVKTFDKVAVNGGAQTSFSDVGGQASAIRELREALDFLKHQGDIRRLGIRPLRGILLTGPPGTGKTLLARAAASYTDAVFLAASGSEFIEMYAGVGAQRVRKLFQSARDTATKQKKKNALIFIDEIEVLGAKRGQNSSHMEYDQTLNQLLVEMDGIKIDDEVQVLLVAATNRADMLDPAILRPGRFDRQVRVDLPDKVGRLEILTLHTRNKPLAKDVNLESLAKDTFGFSGAHLESLANEAAILAMREGAKEIHQLHFIESVDKVIMGGKLDRRPSTEEMRRVAFHETGHAAISEQVRAGSVSTLTITPRGSALGYMRQTSEDDRYLHTQEYLENQISVLLAGAIAEEVFLGSRSTGASSDFEQALNIAELLIKGGMSRLGIVSVGSLPQKEKHAAMQEILQKQETRVRGFLEINTGVFLEIVEELLAKEKLTGEEFRNFLSKSAPAA
ncbi:MAG: AAA family ATPase [Eubacteriales bacterium]|jgi:vesicle-fusing ATPase|nr:AAA family ATPase [Bacillota bacterium]MBV1726737.1 AAA family ATPase [Desulforudis sp.]MDP3051767.1 AAA family ATPase [Eubacteriales bacterium]MDQ7790068.1 AAA family ATPase [Clostridia bacterium]MBV1735643.1 AAA family ATPase [Desulforudis sp.]